MLKLTTDKQTDRQTNRQDKNNMPPIIQSGGIKIGEIEFPLMENEFEVATFHEELWSPAWQQILPWDRSKVKVKVTVW